MSTDYVIAIHRQKSRRWNSWLIGLGAAGLFGTALVFAFYVYRFSGALALHQATWGHFGDYVGGALNWIWSALSFAALVISLLYVRQQLVENDAAERARVFRQTFYFELQALTEHLKSIGRTSADSFVTDLLLKDQRVVGPDGITALVMAYRDLHPRISYLVAPAAASVDRIASYATDNTVDDRQLRNWLLGALADRLTPSEAYLLARLAVAERADGRRALHHLIQRFGLLRHVDTQRRDGLRVTGAFRDVAFLPPELDAPTMDRDALLLEDT